MPPKRSSASMRGKRNAAKHPRLAVDADAEPMDLESPPTRSNRVVSSRGATSSPDADRYRPPAPPLARRALAPPAACDCPIAPRPARTCTEPPLVLPWCAAAATVSEEALYVEFLDMLEVLPDNAPELELPDLELNDFEL